LARAISMTGTLLRRRPVGVGRVPVGAPPRPFQFAADTFAFVNESHWVYVHDPATGRDRLVTAEDVAEGRRVHAVRVAPLLRLVELLRVAEEHDALRPETASVLR
jgi:hypothetical protein